MNNSEIEEILDRIGPPGSEARLKAIASMNLGERSEAATRVLYRRSERKRLMDAGFTRDEALTIVRDQEKHADH